MQKILFLILLLFIKLSAYESVIIKPEHAIDENHLNLGLNILKKHLEKKDITINSHIYNAKDGVEAYINAKADWVAIPPSVYFKNEKLLLKHTKNIWTYSLNENKYYQFYLISHKKNKNVMKNLKKHEITIIELLEPSRYFYYSLLKKKYKNINPLKLNIQRKNKESKIIYDVFFNPKKIGIVSKNSFEVLNELNPQIGKNLKIVAKSRENILPFIALQHKNTNIEEEKKLLELVSKSKGLFIKNTKILGKHLFSGIEKISKEELNETRELYLEYKK